MCRYDPVTKTERRCPSYLDKASYNAKRRARYHSKKNGNAFSANTQTSTAVLTEQSNLMESNTFDLTQYKKITEVVNNNVFKTLYPEKVSYDVSEETVFDSVLNVRSTTCAGELVETDYFSPNLITGQLDHTKLDENSYKIFFEEIDQLKINTSPNFRQNKDISYDSNVYVELSNEETKTLTEKEKNALSYFTGESFEWINEIVYSKNEDIKASEYEDHIESTNYGDATLDDASTGTTTAEKLTSLMNNIDNAIANGPNVQRVVYRGMNYNSDFFTVDVNMWFENTELGQEIKFDSYHSTSQTPSIAKEFINGDGVMFEILTPQGIQISGLSEWQEEFEIILPRDARYSVVGKHKGAAGYLVQLVAINSKGEILDGTNSDPIEPIIIK